MRNQFVNLATKAIAHLHLRKKLRALALLAGCSTLLSCGQLDPYQAKWNAIKLGDSRGTAVNSLGVPSVVNSIEVPIFSAEQLAWRAPFGGHVYIMIVSFDRVVAKTVIN